MTYVRFFNGSSDRITMLAGTGAHSGFGSVVAVVKAASDTGFRAYFGAGAAAPEFDLSSASQLQMWNNTVGSTSADTLTVANGWGIVGVGKATGTTLPRFHRNILSANTWSHTDGSLAIANWSGDTVWTLGEGGSDFWNGYIYCVAYFDAVALSDANYNSINSIASISALNPTGFWILNQQLVSTAVTDSAGKGQNQNTISGTSVFEDTIPNFVMSTASIAWVTA